MTNPRQALRPTPKGTPPSCKSSLHLRERVRIAGRALFFAPPHTALPFDKRLAQKAAQIVSVKGRSSGVEMFSTASSRGTPQERRKRYLRLATEAEITAVRLNDTKAKGAWIDLAVSWMLMASEISPEKKNGRKRKPGRDTKS